MKKIFSCGYKLRGVSRDRLCIETIDKNKLTFPRSYRIELKVDLTIPIAIIEFVRLVP